MIIVGIMTHPGVPATWPLRPPRMPTLTLIATFRTDGWRHALHPGDGLEVWQDAHHVGTLPFELLLQLVWHYVHGTTLAQYVGAHLAPLAPAAPRLPALGARRLRGYRSAP